METQKTKDLRALIVVQAATPNGYVRPESVPKHAMVRLSQELGLKSTRRMFVAHYFSDMKMHDDFVKQTHTMQSAKKIHDAWQKRRDEGKEMRARRDVEAAQPKPPKPKPMQLVLKKRKEKPVKQWNLPAPVQTRPAADFVEPVKPKKEVDFSRATWLRCPPPAYTPLDLHKDCALAPARRAVSCKSGAEA